MFANANFDKRILSEPDEYPAVGRIYALINGSELKAQYQRFGVDDLDKSVQESIRLKKVVEYNFCSATVLPENFLLTAAHCLEFLTPLNLLGVQTYFKAAHPEAPSVLIRISDVWSIGDRGKLKDFKNDWAILKLNQSLTMVRPMRFLKLLDSQKPLVKVHAVGYPYEVRGKIKYGRSQFKTQCNYVNEDKILKKLTKKIKIEFKELMG